MFPTEELNVFVHTAISFSDAVMIMILLILLTESIFQFQNVLIPVRIEYSESEFWNF